MSAESTKSLAELILEAAEKSTQVEFVNEQNEIIGVFNAIDIANLVHSYTWLRKIVYPPKKEPYRRQPTPWRYKKDKTQKFPDGKVRETSIWEVWVGNDMIGRVLPYSSWRNYVNWYDADERDLSKANYSHQGYGHTYLSGTRDGAAQKLYDRWQAQKEGANSDDTGPA